MGNVSGPSKVTAALESIVFKVPPQVFEALPVRWREIYNDVSREL